MKDQNAPAKPAAAPPSDPVGQNGPHPDGLHHDSLSPASALPDSLPHENLPHDSLPHETLHDGAQAVGLSAVLIALAHDQSRDRVSIGDMLAIMRDRAFGALLLIFAFPNILPSPPGLAGVLGLPLIFLATQMMLGRAPWLPQVIARRSMSREIFATMVGKVTPWIRRAESLMHPRLERLAGPAGQRVLGLICLILAVALALPVPFANLAPAAAISVIGLGILQRDGLWIGIGLIGAIVALAWVVGLGYALFKSLIFVVGNAF